MSDITEPVAAEAAAESAPASAGPVFGPRTLLRDWVIALAFGVVAATLQARGGIAQIIAVALMFAFSILLIRPLWRWPRVTPINVVIDVIQLFLGVLMLELAATVAVGHGGIPIWALVAADIVGATVLTLLRRFWLPPPVGESA